MSSTLLGFGDSPTDIVPSASATGMPESSTAMTTTAGASGTAATSSVGCVANVSPVTTAGGRGDPPHAQADAHTTAHRFIAPPYQIARCAQRRKTLRWGDEHFALVRVIRRAHHALLLHLLDEPCGPVVADAELALDPRDRRVARRRDDVHRLVVHVVVALAAGELHVAAVFRI